MPGFGLTGPSPENVYTYTYFSTFLDSFLHKLQVKSCILAGNSLGGGIAWHFSLAYPDKVSKLILIDAIGYPIKNEKGALGFKIARMPIVGNLLLFITPKTLVEKSLENVFYNKSFVTASTITRYHDLLLSEGNRKAALSMFQHPMKQSENDIRQINKPTLILWGEQDQLISVNNAYLFNQDIKGSEVEVYKNVGHIPMEEAPVLTAGSIERFIFQK
jgi:pimeloyl-ACP methyl ester carboxylesterase